MGNFGDIAAGAAMGTSSGLEAGKSAMGIAKGATDIQGAMQQQKVGAQQLEMGDMQLQQQRMIKKMQEAPGPNLFTTLLPQKIK